MFSSKTSNNSNTTNTNANQPSVTSGSGSNQATSYPNATATSSGGVMASNMSTTGNTVYATDSIDNNTVVDSSSSNQPQVHVIDSNKPVSNSSQINQERDAHGNASPPPVNNSIAHSIKMAFTGTSNNTGETYSEYDTKSKLHPTLDHAYGSLLNRHEYALKLKSAMQLLQRQTVDLEHNLNSIATLFQVCLSNGTSTVTPFENLANQYAKAHLEMLQTRPTYPVDAVSLAVDGFDSHHKGIEQLISSLHTQRKEATHYIQKVDKLRSDRDERMVGDNSKPLTQAESERLDRNIAKAHLSMNNYNATNKSLIDEINSLNNAPITQLGPVLVALIAHEQKSVAAAHELLSKVSADAKALNVRHESLMKSHKPLVAVGTGNIVLDNMGMDNSAARHLAQQNVTQHNTNTQQASNIGSENVGMQPNHQTAQGIGAANSTSLVQAPLSAGATSLSGENQNTLNAGAGSTTIVFGQDQKVRFERVVMRRYIVNEIVNVPIRLRHEQLALDRIHVEGNQADEPTLTTILPVTDNIQSSSNNSSLMNNNSSSMSSNSSSMGNNFSSTGNNSSSLGNSLNSGNSAMANTNQESMVNSSSMGNSLINQGAMGTSTGYQSGSSNNSGSNNGMIPSSFPLLRELPTITINCVPHQIVQVETMRETGAALNMDNNQNQNYSRQNIGSGFNASGSNYGSMQQHNTYDQNKMMSSSAQPNAYHTNESSVSSGMPSTYDSQKTYGSNQPSTYDSSKFFGTNQSSGYNSGTGMSTGTSNQGASSFDNLQQSQNRNVASTTSSRNV